jgi:hypothetical protein
LRSLERKQGSIINVLRREYDKITRMPETKLSAYQLLWRKKQVEANYTLKLPESDRTEMEAEKVYRNGWRVTPIKQATEKKNLRMKMIEVGNSFSRMNRSSSISIAEVPKQRNAFNFKQEMLAKAKILGNQYSKIFNKRDKFQRSFLAVDELDRYHRLLAQKQEAEKFYEINKKYGRKVGNSFVGEYSKLYEEILRLNKLLKFQFHLPCGEFEV